MGILLTGVQSLSESHVSQEVCTTGEECFREAQYFQENNPELISDQLKRFRSIHQTDPTSLWGKRAGVHVGLLLLTEDPSAALPYFQTGLRDFPVLDDYFHFWIGEALLKAGQVRQAAETFQSFVEQFPQSILATEVSLQAGRAWYTLGECGPAADFLHSGISEEPDDPSAPRDLLELADCALKLGQTSRAREVLQEVWWRFPDTPEASSAQDRLDAMGQKKGHWVPSVKVRYKRANRFYRLALFPEAIADFQHLLSHGLIGSRQSDAKFDLGMAYVRLKQYHRAAPLFEELVEKGDANAGKASVWLAKSYLRQDRGQELLSLRNKKAFARLSPSRKAKILWMGGLWLEDQGRIEKARASYREAAQTAGSSSAGRDALWRIGWMAYRSQDYESAIATFKQLDAAAGIRSVTLRARYWSARALENSGKKDAAQTLYAHLAHEFPGTYYGQLSRLRFQEDDSFSHLPQSGKRFFPPKTEKLPALTRNLHVQKAQELMEFRLYEEAKNELLATVDNFRSDPEVVSETLVLLNQARAYSDALALAQRYFEDQIDRGQFDVYPGLELIAYPTGYLPVIQAYGGKKLDPFLVSALIREESLYDTEALSPVGAVGLMQLMPKTANRVAQKFGLPGVEKEALKVGDTNIRLGTLYLQQLLDQFEDDMVHAVAAYNAGPQAVHGWISRFGNSETDEFVELISYRETRRYVKRVFTSYRTYHWLISTTYSG